MWNFNRPWLGDVTELMGLNIKTWHGSVQNWVAKILTWFRTMIWNGLAYFETNPTGSHWIRWNAHLVRIVGGVHGQGLAHGSVHQMLQARSGHIHLHSRRLKPRKIRTQWCQSTKYSNTLQHPKLSKKKLSCAFTSWNVWMKRTQGIAYAGACVHVVAIKKWMQGSGLKNASPSATARLPSQGWNTYFMYLYMSRRQNQLLTPGAYIYIYVCVCVRVCVCVCVYIYVYIYIYLYLYLYLCIYLYIYLYLCLCVYFSFI